MCFYLRKNLLPFAAAVFAIAAAVPCAAQAGPILGFELELSEKAAFETAKHKGLRAVREGKQKDGRKQVVFNGSLAAVQFPEGGVRTRLTFFKGKIETVAVLTDGAASEDALAIERFLVKTYGAPDADEQVFSYTVKSWLLADSRLTFSRSEGGVMKLAQTHLKVLKKRRERDIARSKLKDKRSPVQKILDGDYSSPDYSN